MTITKPVRTFAEFSAHDGAKARLRARARDLAIRALSFTRQPGQGSGWIRFPFWHHVFDDERQGFARQLSWMKRYGEFIGFSDAVSLLASGDSISGRYFCPSFDDGFKNVATNAAPILGEAGARAMVFLATGYTGETDPQKLRQFYDHGRLQVDFMDWDDARAWLAGGHEVGSHTRTHACLARLDAANVLGELQTSKLDIENGLGIDCRHFCCPWGRPGIDFLIVRDPALAARVGYASFATTARGGNHRGDSPFAIHRDHLLANEPDYHLRYFLGVRP
ncbi:MAG: polysaccharide deacetylase family protein [Rhodospirillales bacterium]|nr:polysaccharide deacetylase family protein [Rhodospirillales bacterium]